MNLKNLIPSENVLDCTSHVPTLVDALYEHIPLILIWLGLCVFVLSLKFLSSEIRIWYNIRKVRKHGMPAYRKYETYTESLNSTKHSDYSED